MKNQNSELEMQKYANWTRHIGLGDEWIKNSKPWEYLSDGVFFLRISDHIKAGSVDWHKVNNPASNSFQKMSNCSYLATVCKTLGIPTEGLKTKETVQGNPEACLGMLWLLMRQSFIIINGAKNEEEIKKLAQQFEAMKENTKIHPDDPDFEPLRLVYYYGEEGEVFQTFHDEEELDCPFLPTTFDTCVQKETPKETPFSVSMGLARESIKQSKGGPVRSTKKKRLCEDVEEMPNRKETVYEDYGLRDSSEKSSFVHLVVSIGCSCKVIPASESEKPYCIPNHEIRRQIVKSKPKERMQKSNLLDAPSRKIFKVPATQNSEAMKADEPEEIAFIPNLLLNPQVSLQQDTNFNKDHQIKAASSLKSHPVNEFMSADKSKTHAENAKDIQEILDNNANYSIPTLKNSIQHSASVNNSRGTPVSKTKSGGVPVRPFYMKRGNSSEASSAPMLSRTDSNNQSQQKDQQEIGPLENLNTEDLAKNIWVDNEEQDKSEGGFMKLSKSESSEQNTLKVVKNQPLAVSEIIDEYDRAGTSYAFEEYASAMRGMKALVKDKNVQNKSQFMQFKVGNSSPSIAYYLRIPQGLNEVGMRIFIKTHNKFAGFHFEDIFNKALLTSEFVDTRNEGEKVDLLKSRVEKLAQKLSLFPEVASFLQAMMTFKDQSKVFNALGALKLDHLKAEKQNKLMLRRVKYLAKTGSPPSKIKSLTKAEIYNQNYLSIEKVSNLQRSETRVFYMETLLHKLRADEDNPSYHASKVFSTKIGKLLNKYLDENPHIDKYKVREFLRAN